MSLVVLCLVAPAALLLLAYSVHTAVVRLRGRWGLGTASRGDDVVARRLSAAVGWPAAEHVMSVARAHGIRPATMADWQSRIGSDALAVAVAAGASEEQLRAHLQGHETLDPWSMALTAELNGYSALLSR
ncbi:hypothetical protein [Nocardioides aquiterrae]|uniref:Uncharacterized protein n=1 Tax=Nocardioides aquiterrae TaxID=203799 RepID=A0ABP4F0R3_9ACTN